MVEKRICQELGQSINVGLATNRFAAPPHHTAPDWLVDGAKKPAETQSCPSHGSSDETGLAKWQSLQSSRCNNTANAGTKTTNCKTTVNTATKCILNQRSPIRRSLPISPPLHHPRGLAKKTIEYQLLEQKKSPCTKIISGTFTEAETVINCHQNSKKLDACQFEIGCTHIESKQSLPPQVSA